MNIVWPTWTAFFFSNVIYGFGNYTAGPTSQCGGGIQCGVFDIEQACPRNSAIQDCDFRECGGKIVLKNWGLTGYLDLTQFRKKITHLDLSNNELSGIITFPDSVEAACATMGLETLILSNNKIYGEFPFEKLRAKDLRYLELAGNNFVTCTPGQHQLPNSMDCGLCSPGSFSAKPGLLECEKCPEGKFQNNWGSTTCEQCPFGRYNNASRASECLECHVGKFNNVSGRTICTECVMGMFQGLQGKSKCDICPFGYFSGPGNFIRSECNVCGKGEFAKPFDQKCSRCSQGKFVSEEHFNATNGEEVCLSDGSGLIVLAVMGGMAACCCISCCSVVCLFTGFCGVIKERYDHCRDNCVGRLQKCGSSFKIFHEARKRRQLRMKMRRWKPPQSKNDAEIAEHFILPKAANEIKDCIKNFKLMETELIRNRKWNDDQLRNIQFNYETVVMYLGGRMDEARKDKVVERLLCCYHGDELVDFQELYGKTMSIITSREEDGMEKFTNASSRLEKCRLAKCPPNPESLFDLYNSGRRAYDLFHQFLEKAANHVAGAKCYKKGEKEDQFPGMKGIYRVLEKGMFKYNKDGRIRLKLSKVRDLVRGGIIHRKMQGLAEVVNFFYKRHQSGEITICRIKDRFSNPSASGWTDMMINFSLAADPGEHVCEVQLIHRKMFIQRTVQEGHTAYNRFRAAQELLITVSRALRHPNPASDEALNDLKKKVALGESIF